MEVTGNCVPGAVGQGRCALLSGLEMTRVDGAGKIRQLLPEVVATTVASNIDF